jgi:quercetin dioxygenase-like cupin family protein
MQIIRRDDVPSRTIAAHHSQGASVAHLLGASPHTSLVRIHLAPGGVLGMHPAAEDQLFVLVRGGGTVRSEASPPVEMAEGDMAFWRRGELHETRAGPDGLTALVVEGPSLNEALPRP